MPDQAEFSLSGDRVASLSDTMFGVAMALVVTTLLPSIQAHRGPALEMVPAMAGELVTVVLSFALSARYWISQQSRLAVTRTLTPVQAWLHLAFLLLVVLVPITTSLPGLVGPAADRGSVVIYGAHLALLSAMNLVLWLGVHRTTAAHLQVARSGLAAALFAVALAVGAWRPGLALYLWIAVLPMGPVAHRIARRWRGG
jgi:uncharacterized membrane protein